MFEVYACRKKPQTNTKNKEKKQKDEESRKRQGEISISGITSASFLLQATGAKSPHKGIRFSKKKGIKSKLKFITIQDSPVLFFLTK